MRRRGPLEQRRPNGRGMAQAVLGRRLMPRLRGSSVCAVQTWETTVMHERNRPVFHRRARATLRRTPLAVAISGVLAATALPTIALAQDDQGVAVEEIVVTATRREQNIQDIPINIASFSGDALEQRGIEDLAELGRNVRLDPAACVYTAFAVPFEPREVLGEAIHDGVGAASD